MELLDKYKNAWKNQPEDDRKVSKLEIYKLIHSKSSSIVKWIFIIGIVEFLFWIVINLMVPDSYYQIYDDLNLHGFLNAAMVAHYCIVVVFLLFFYKNYEGVSILESTKSLMKNILKVRNTVKYYVYYNLVSVFLISLVVNFTIFSDTEKLNVFINPENLAMDLSQLITVTIISQIIALVFILFFLWLFYKLIYGILLKKLNKNYAALVRLEEED